MPTEQRRGIPLDHGGSLVDRAVVDKKDLAQRAVCQQRNHGLKALAHGGGTIPPRNHQTDTLFLHDRKECTRREDDRHTSGAAAVVELDSEAWRCIFWDLTGSACSLRWHLGLPDVAADS